jgi:6-methylsalicylate decarboxylase
LFRKSIEFLAIVKDALALEVMSKLDVHQHLWTEPLLHALAERHELPFVRRQNGVTVLFLAGERPYLIDTAAESPARRAELVEADGLDGAIVCLSSSLGIESLPRAECVPFIDAYHEGALSLGAPFGVWGAIPLEHPNPSDVDHALDRGCVGIALPAGALAGVDALSRLHSVLARLEMTGAPVLVHPGPGAGLGPASQAKASLNDPLWWPALTTYVAQMQAAWLTFLGAGRREHPDLRVIFSMLAGLAPLQAERLKARGGPPPALADSRLFYDTSSYGPAALTALGGVVGPSQLLYGSDPPVIEPAELETSGVLDWEAIARGLREAFGRRFTNTMR